VEKPARRRRVPQAMGDAWFVLQYGAESPLPQHPGLSKAFAPIEISLLRRSAPGVGLRRRKEECFSVGAGRPSAEGPWRPNSFGAQADRRPKTLAPIEIGL
jgi:hypothetical protein